MADEETGEEWLDALVDEGIAALEVSLAHHAEFEDYCAGKENDGSQETTGPQGG